MNAAPWGAPPPSAASNPAVGWGDSNPADASGWAAAPKSDSGWGAQSDAGKKSSDAKWSESYDERPKKTKKTSISTSYRYLGHDEPKAFVRYRQTGIETPAWCYLTQA